MIILIKYQVKSLKSNNLLNNLGDSKLISSNFYEINIIKNLNKVCNCLR